MDNQLPTEFDLIIVGTGVIESIISAAASRIGKTVLHVDSNDYYGAQWASFNLKSLHNFSPQNEQVAEYSNNSVKLGNNYFNIKNFCTQWHVPDKLEIDSNSEDELETDIIIKDEEKQNRNDTVYEQLEKIKVENLLPKRISKQFNFSQETLLQYSRKFNIDLLPKLHFARGEFVELLISSNIARYAEYRSTSRILTWLNGKLEIVPCSRSDVFANNRVTVIEKRMLMKLLTSLDENSEDLKNYENKTFHQFLVEKKLTENLIHFVLYAISHSTKTTSCNEGIENTKRFLNSLGRFGKTPFLFSMYGSGETTQAFCRLSAVFGGIFALNQKLLGLVLKNNEVEALINGEQEIKAKHFVLSSESAPSQIAKSIEIKEYISRAIFITDQSVMISEQEHLTLIMYPPENGKDIITIIEMGSLTGTCPKNLFLVHLITKQNTNPKEDFKHVVANLFANQCNSEDLVVNQKPHILWSCYFSLPCIGDINLTEDNLTNLHLCSGPDLDLDYDLCIKKAKSIFQKMYPKTDFLPRAPDPEEIIFGGDDEHNTLANLQLEDRVAEDNINK